MERDAGRKTALLISSHASVVGGGQVSLLLLLRFLPRDRFTPVLLCPSEGEVASRARNLDVDVAVLSIGSPLDSVSALGRALLLRRQARRMRAAVVHCDTLYAALACGMGLWGLRVPLVFHARVAQSGGRWDAIVPRVCTRIICVSEAVAARFPSCAPSQVRVIYNGVDLSALRPGLDGRGARERLGIARDAFVVGYAGQLLKTKGLETLIRAFARLRTEFPEARLALAGRGGDEPALRAAAGDGVLFVPFSDSMPGFYSALDAFALPTAHGEGLSRSLIEAMACGLPAVATASGGNVETLVQGETGWFVPVGDESALLERLRHLYLRPEERTRMGRAARKRAEELFDASACARAVEALYCEVAG